MRNFPDFGANARNCDIAAKPVRRSKCAKPHRGRHAEYMLKVKQEAPPPAPFATAYDITHSPVAPGPPRTMLPRAETIAAAPKVRSAIVKPPPKGKSTKASIARMSAAAAVRREKREALEALQAGAGPSTSSEEVVCTGECSWEARDVALRDSAVHVDDSD